jgi:hypothetical protein
VISLKVAADEPELFTRIWALQPEQSAPTRPKHMVAVDVLDEKPQAWKLCADCMVHTGTEDSVQAIKDLGGVAHGPAVAPKALGRAYGSVGRGGRLVFVALPANSHVQLHRLRDRAERYPDHGLDRREPDRSGRGVRFAQGEPHPRGREVRKHEEVNRRSKRWRREGGDVKQGPARLVFEPHSILGRAGGVATARPPPLESAVRF